MRLLVIGNGFDLAHELPTSTSDFVDYYLGDNCSQMGSARSAEFESLRDSGSNKGWCKLVASNCLSPLWDGFEKEISRVIQLWDSARNNSGMERFITNSVRGLEKYKSFFNISSIEMNNDDEEIVWLVKENMEDSLLRITRALELYLCALVNSKKVEPIKSIESLNPDKIISFNYTNTAERTYGEIWNFPEICYIHGKAGRGTGIKDTDLIFGIDEYLDEYDRQKDNYYIKFKKFYQRIIRKTGTDYKRWIQPWTKSIEGKSEKLWIDFYGHSLSLADKDIIKELIMLHDATITIHYYDKNALESIVMNISAIIGPDNLIEMTGCHPPKIILAEIEK